MMTLRKQLRYRNASPTKNGKTDLGPKNFYRHFYISLNATSKNIVVKHLKTPNAVHCIRGSYLHIKSLFPEGFTMPEIQKAYEAILNEELEVIKNKGPKKQKIENN